MTIIRFCLTICFIHTVATVIAEKSDYQVDLVQVLIANGDRTPEKDETFPKDPLDSTHWKQMGYGKLTKWGEQHSRRLGEVLRDRYDDFLGDYDPRHVYAFSTDEDLTRKTLQKVLKGLYPRSRNPNWSELQNYITYSERNNEHFLSSVNKYCTRYVNLYEAAEKSPKIAKEIGKYESFIWYVRMETGFPHIEPQITGSKLMNYWLSVGSLNLPLPEWCSRECLKNLYGLAALHVEISVLNNDLARMAVGPTLEIISQRLADVNSATSVNPTKIFLYAAREFNLGTMTQALKLKDLPEVPNYSSALIFERLRNKKGKTFVRVLYYTGPSDQLVAVQLKKPKHNALTNAALKCINCSSYCEDECPLDTFAKIVEPLLPKPEDKQCMAQ